MVARSSAIEAVQPTRTPSHCDVCVTSTLDKDATNESYSSIKRATSSDCDAGSSCRFPTRNRTLDAWYQSTIKDTISRIHLGFAGVNQSTPQRHLVIERYPNRYPKQSLASLCIQSSVSATMKPSLTLLFTISAALAAAMPENWYEYEEPFSIVRRGSWDAPQGGADGGAEAAPRLPSYLAAKIPEKYHGQAAKIHQQQEEEDSKARQAHFAKLLGKESIPPIDHKKNGKIIDKQRKDFAARQRQKQAGGAEGKASGAEGRSSGAGGRSSSPGGRPSGGMASIPKASSPRRGRGGS